MRKLLAFILFMPFVTSGQESAFEDRIASGVSSFYMGATFSPELAYRVLSNADGSQSSSSILHSRNDEEIYKFGFSGGLAIGFKMRKRFGLETGINYSNMGYQSKRIDLVYSGLEDPRKGDLYASLTEPLDQLKTIASFEYIGIPIALKYWSETEKWRFTAALGCSVNYLVKASTTFVSYLNDEQQQRVKSTSSSDFNELNLISFVGAGIEHQLTSRMCLSVMPTARYGFIHIIDAPISAQLFNYGIEFGWRLKFKSDSSE